MTPEPIVLREGYADLDTVRLHYMEAGEGPLVVLLHGFPEFWYSWRSQIPGLARAGFRVVAPDLRGYNLSSRPESVADCEIDLLAADVRDLIRERGERSALVAGHDWGAAVAWALAMNHPETVRRLAILNLPHPRRLMRAMLSSRQLLKSWYMFFFQVPWLPERLAAAGGWLALRRTLTDASLPGSFTAADIELYVEAWSRPGAIRGMINYYRAALRQPPWRAEGRIRPVLAPTLVIFGEQDRYLRHQIAEPYRADVPNLERVVLLPGATHFVNNDEPELVNRLLADFFSSASGH